MKRRHITVSGGVPVERLRQEVIRQAQDDGRRVLVCEGVHWEDADELPLSTPPDAQGQVLFATIGHDEELEQKTAAAQAALSDAESARKEAKAATEAAQLVLERAEKQGKELRDAKEEKERKTNEIKDRKKDLEEAKEEARIYAEQVRQLEASLALVEPQGQTVQIRFLVQYAFHVIKAASKLPSEDSSENIQASMTFDSFLNEVDKAGSLELEVLHPSLPPPFSGSKLDIAPFVELLRRHGHINGLLSNRSCHSASLKSMGAAVEGQLKKVDQGQVGILSKSELLELRKLFQELFGVSTVEAAHHNNKMFLVEFFLPDSNQKR